MMATKTKRWAKQFHSDERVHWLQSFGCCVPHCARADAQVHHVRTRGAGGTWRDTVPLCVKHHRELHDIGRDTFAARHDVDLHGQARKFVSWWERVPRDEAF